MTNPLKICKDRESMVFFRLTG